MSERFQSLKWRYRRLSSPSSACCTAFAQILSLLLLAGPIPKHMKGQAVRFRLRLQGLDRFELISCLIGII